MSIVSFVDLGSFKLVNGIKTSVGRNLEQCSFWTTEVVKKVADGCTYNDIPAIKPDVHRFYWLTPVEPSITLREVFTSDTTKDTKDSKYPLYFVMIEPAEASPSTPVARCLDGMGMFSRRKELVQQGSISSEKYTDVIAYGIEVEGLDEQWKLDPSER